MGMAASQARLLSITSRLADNELRAQIINNNKMRLASASSKASEDYIAALNAATMMITNYDENGTQRCQKLNFNSLTQYSAQNNQYGLVDANGNILVSEKEADMFKQAAGNVDRFLALHGLSYTTNFFDPENFKLDNASLGKNGHILPEIDAETGEEIANYYSDYTLTELEDMYNNYYSNTHSVTFLNYTDTSDKLYQSNDAYTKFMNKIIYTDTPSFKGIIPTISDAATTCTTTAKSSYSDNAVLDTLAINTYIDEMCGQLSGGPNSSGFNFKGVLTNSGYSFLQGMIDYLESINNGTDSAYTISSESDYLVTNTSKVNASTVTWPIHIFDITKTLEGGYKYAEGSFTRMGTTYNTTTEYLGPIVGEGGQYAFRKQTTTNTATTTSSTTYQVYADTATHDTARAGELLETLFNNVYNNLDVADKMVLEAAASAASGGTTSTPTGKQILEYYNSKYVDRVDGYIKMADILKDAGMRINTDGSNTFNENDSYGYLKRLCYIYCSTSENTCYVDVNKDLQIGNIGVDKFYYAIDSNNDGTGDTGTPSTLNLTYNTNVYSSITVRDINNMITNIKNPMVSQSCFYNMTGCKNDSNGNLIALSVPLNRLTDEQKSHYTFFVSRDKVTRNLEWDDVTDIINQINSYISTNLANYLDIYDSNKVYNDWLAANGCAEALGCKDLNEARDKYSKLNTALTEDFNATLPTVFNALDSDIVYYIDDEGKLANAKYSDLKANNGYIGKNKDKLLDPAWLYDHFSQGALDKKEKGHTSALRTDFNTIKDVFVIDDLLSVFGDPKVAWVDTADKNADGDSKAQWFTNLFNKMQQGYKVLEDGLAKSSEWMQYALESGLVVINQVDSTFNWIGTQYSNIADITEVTDDVAVARAEAEYKKAMNEIENKDKRYDQELKNIDTEHSALQTEYDSIKSVISKNIERSFKIYS